MALDIKQMCYWHARQEGKFPKQSCGPYRAQSWRQRTPIMAVLSDPGLHLPSDSRPAYPALFQNLENQWQMEIYHGSTGPPLIVGGVVPIFTIFFSETHHSDFFFIFDLTASGLILYIVCGKNSILDQSKIFHQHWSPLANDLPSPAQFD